MTPEERAGIEKYLEVLSRKLDSLIAIVQKLQKRVNNHIESER